MSMKTLNEILKEHPEWGDLVIGIYMPDGHYDMLDGAGDVYVDKINNSEADYTQDELDRGDVLVFAGN